MNRNVRVVILVALAGVALFAVAGLLSRPEPALAASRPLSQPTFLQTSLPQSPDGGNVIEAEAGIAAYFESGVPIDLNNIRGEFRTIEQETNNYILGSIPLPDYNETMDVHIFAHKNGSVLAYFRNTDPASKAVDLVHWDGETAINTNLETALNIIAEAAFLQLPAINFYHFGYPNATHMTLIAELHNDEDNNTFQVELPSTNGYFERSAAGNERGLDLGVQFWIENTQVLTCDNGSFCYNLVLPSNLPLDTLVTATVQDLSDVAALVLIYMVP